MIIDFHTHAFPVSLAPRAIESLAAISQYPPVLDGTLDDLRRSMERAGIDASVVLNIATNARQTENVNSFAIKSSEIEGIIPFGSIHPDYTNVKAELARLSAAGIKGLKFHPDFQDFRVDDKRRMYPLYEEALRYGFIMIFHCGHDLDRRTDYNCTPESFARVVRDFAGAKIVGAHLGGQDMWDEVFEHTCGLDVYLDVSYSFGLLTDAQLARFLAGHDHKKILFGTDSPWQEQAEDVKMMRARIKNDALYSAIMGGNAADLLGIS